MISQFALKAFVLLAMITRQMRAEGGSCRKNVRQSGAPEIDTCQTDCHITVVVYLNEFEIIIIGVGCCGGGVIIDFGYHQSGAL